MKQSTRYFLAVFCIFIFSSIWSNAQEGIHRGVVQSDFNALMDFYEATNDPDDTGNPENQWVNSYGWDSEDIDVNFWKGVWVENNRVIEIELDNNNIIGELPLSLGDLDGMKYLNLSENSVSGDLPQGISDWENLLQIRLAWTNLSGDLSILQNLSHLEEIVIVESNFGGDIQPLLENLKNLREFNVFGEGVYGTIPEEILELQYLEYFSIVESQINPVFPEQFFNLTTLKGLELSVVGFDLENSPEIWNWPNLEFLEMAGNKFEGQIPQQVAQLTSLKELSFLDNRLNGPIPNFLFELPDLVRLNLSHNNFGPDDCLKIQELTSSKTWDWITVSPQRSGYNFGVHCGQDIDLVQGVFRQDYEVLLDIFDKTGGSEWTNKYGWGSTEISVDKWHGLDVENLRVVGLFLANNNLSGELPASIGLLDELRAFNVGFNEIGGVVPSTIGDLSLLNELLINNNWLIGPLPLQILNLTNLRKANIWANDLDEADCQTVNLLRNLPLMEEFFHSPQQDENLFYFYDCWNDCGLNNATQLIIGDNLAPNQEVWYEYTATEYKLLTITSCNTSTEVEPGTYGLDTYIRVYDNCETLIAWNDDMESACSLNRASASVSFITIPGHTYTIYWPYAFNTGGNFSFIFQAYLDPVPEIEANFEVLSTVVQIGEACEFYDKSTGYPNGWEWLFPGSDNLDSDLQNPINITYSTPGVYKVELKAANQVHNGYLSKENYILVLDGDYSGEQIFIEEFDCEESGLPDGWTQYDFSNTGKNWIWANSEIPSLINVPFLPSTSSDNGYMVFPANIYNSHDGSWFVNLFSSYLQSPPINCQGYESLVLTMEDLFRWWMPASSINNGTIIIQISNDGGSNWTDYDLKRGLEIQEISGEPLSKPLIHITNLALNQSSVEVRFLWKDLPWYYWLIDDVQILGIPMSIPVSIEVDPVVFMGYDQAGCTSIVPEIDGGVEPYTYQWSTGETTESIEVCPEDYSGMKSIVEYWVMVTDFHGSKGKAVFNVEFVDVNCGKNEDKVLLCVNGKNPHTICVSPNAVPAHLAKGATLGPCGEKSGFFDDISNVLTFSCDIYPNPSDGKVSLDITMVEKGDISIDVKDMLGRSIIKRTQSLGEGTNHLEMDLTFLSKGLYVVEIIAGYEKVTETLSIQ